MATLQILFIIHIFITLVTACLLQIYCMKYALTKRKRRIHGWEVSFFIVMCVIPIFNIRISYLLVNEIKLLRYVNR